MKEKELFEIIKKEYERHMENDERLVRPFVIGIDGRCGAGKSTLAQRLSQIYNGGVIHMDDFFLPPSLRTTERLDEPGGNVHYERFINEVALPLRKSRATVSYRRFDCGIMDYSDEIKISTDNMVIIEGSYALHPKIEEHIEIYNMKLFCTVDPELQKQRILARNGEDSYKNFRDKWIPMEERYFDQCLGIDFERGVEMSPKSVFSGSQRPFVLVELTE